MQNTYNANTSSPDLFPFRYKGNRGKPINSCSNKPKGQTKTVTHVFGSGSHSD